MSGMNQFLSEYFGTGAPDNDEIQKQAQVEMFLKLAEEEGIDIDQLSDAQVEELYASTFGEEDGGEEVDEDGLEVQAMAEWAQQKEAADKFAEAEFMGRTMAHAYVSELNKIAGNEDEYSVDEDGYVVDSDGDYVDEDGTKLAFGKDKPGRLLVGRTGGHLAPRLRAGGDRETMRGGPAGLKAKKSDVMQFGRDKGLDTKTMLGKARSRVRGQAQQLRRGFLTPNQVGGSTGDPVAQRVGRLARRGLQEAKAAPGKIKNLAGRGADATKAFAKTRKGKAALIGGGLAAAGAAGGGIYAATREKKATAALDRFAGELAVEKLAYAGFDVDEAVERITAIITLDDGENTKVAFAGSPEEAVEIRSLELAELAGYPVDWEA